MPEKNQWDWMKGEGFGNMGIEQDIEVYSVVQNSRFLYIIADIGWR
jgi:hypothetical protein